MFRRLGALGPALLGLCLALGPATASAQGLIWSLPEDGEWVRYEGTIRQIEFQPESVQGNIELPQLIRHLTIKSVGAQTAEYLGEAVPCRWIEIKIVTGRERGGDLDPGPVGTRIYKALVPESRVIGETHDEAGVLVSFLPIVEGYSKVGNDEPKPIPGGVLQVYPTISWLHPYRELQTENEQPQPEAVGWGQVDAIRYTAQMTMERSDARSIHDATLWHSEDVPFGLARWTVKIVREIKDAREPRSAFQPVSEINVEMHAQERGSGAQSELPLP